MKMRKTGIVPVHTDYIKEKTGRWAENNAGRAHLHSHLQLTVCGRTRNGQATDTADTDSC